MRRVGTFGFSTSIKCQLMLSPSRSSSVARNSSLTPFSAAFSSVTFAFFLGGTMYSAWNSLSTWMPNRAQGSFFRLSGISDALFGRSRM